MIDQSVGVIGVGRLGSDVAFTLAERDLCNIVLYDQDSDKAEYLASDLSDTSFGHAYNRRVAWVDSLQELSTCGVILIAAGARRGPGATLRQLYDANASMIREMATHFVGSSNLFVVASEPVDLMTALLARELKLPQSRVMGIGGVVDSYRVRYALGEAMQMGPEYIRSHVAGPHSADMHVLWEYTSVNGIPIRTIAPADLLADLESKLRAESESRLGDMNDSYSRYTPAMACLELLRSIVTDDRRILSVTVPWIGELGIDGVAMSLPAVIGRFGAERTLTPGTDGQALVRLKENALELAAILRGDE